MAETTLNSNLTLLNESTVNSSMKITTASIESLEFKYTKVTFYFVILFCATFGNLMVVYVICTSRRMKSASHLLIMNLAICDFFTPLISIPFDFALEEKGYEWFYGDFLCKILYPAATFSTTASSLTLAAISLDRYRLLMHPFKKKLSAKQIKVMMIGIYIFCASIVSPYTYVLNVNNNGCNEQWPRFLYRQLYTMSLFLFQYAIPLVFMTVMYTLAIINLYSTSGKVRHCSIQGTSRKQNLASQNGGISPKRRVLSKMNPFRKTSIEENPNIRATKMFIAVVVVFAMFMFPNQIIWLWVDFGSGGDQNYAQIAIICWLFTYTNSVVNPIIFAIFSKDFRVGFKGVFRLIFCCNQEALPERCRRGDCHKSDSSTNDILRDKDKQHALAYEFSTCNTNTTYSVDTLTRDDSHFCSRILTKDFNYNSDLKKELGHFPHCERKVIKLCDSDEAQATDKPANEMSPRRKTGIVHTVLEVEEIENNVMEDKGTLQNQYNNILLPVLPPNSIAILDELPETDC